MLCVLSRLGFPCCPMPFCVSLLINYPPFSPSQVLEWVPNGSLEDLLSADTDSRPVGASMLPCVANLHNS